MLTGICQSLPIIICLRNYINMMKWTETQVPDCEGVQRLFGKNYWKLSLQYPLKCITLTNLGCRLFLDSSI